MILFLDAQLNALVFSAATFVLALTTRQLGLFNLAGGAWMVLGGWVCAWILGFFTGVEVALSPLVLAALAVLAVFQCIAPLLLGRVLRGEPMSYLMFTIGVSMVVVSLGQSQLISAHGATIPFSASPWTRVSLLLGSVAVAWTAHWVMGTRFWAQTVMHVRFSPVAGSRPWANVVCLIAIEISLLMLLGALTLQSHKGVFGAASMRTLIPLLALLATKTRPFRAAVHCFITVTGAELLRLAFPSMDRLALPVAAAILGVAVCVRAKLHRQFHRIREVRVVPDCVDAGSFDRETHFRAIPLVVVISVVLLWLAHLGHSVASASIVSQKFLHYTLLALLAAFCARFLGAPTVCWPALGGSFLYASALADGPATALLITVVLLVPTWVVFMGLLRMLRTEIAIVLDLSALLFFHQLAGLSVLYDPNDVRKSQFSLFEHLGIWPGLAEFMQLTLVVAVLALMWLANIWPRLRVHLYALSNPRVGATNGISVIGTFGVVGGLAAVAAILSFGFYRTVSPPFGPDDFTLGVGLTILLYGVLVNNLSAPLAVVCLLVTQVFLETLVAAHGTWLETITGVAFIAVATFLARHRLQDEKT